MPDPMNLIGIGVLFKLPFYFMVLFICLAYLWLTWWPSLVILVAVIGIWLNWKLKKIRDGSGTW